MQKVTVSVLMPTFNADRYIQQSINSVLGQTFEDFELLVVDDASVDNTAVILNNIRDPRLRIIRNASNLGVVSSLNKAMAEARGSYIARTDADDICYPVRLARQVSFLNKNPNVLMVGTRMANMERGKPRPSRRISEPDLAVLRWLFCLSNPVGHPSMMFRANVVDRLGSYLRKEFQDAEDFDFSHRILRHGDVAVLPETLMLYRLHAQNITRVRRMQVLTRTSAVLSSVYKELLGHTAEEEGEVVASYLISGTPIPNGNALARLGKVLDVLLDAFLSRYNLTEGQRSRCEQHAAGMWWSAVQAGLRSGLAPDVMNAWSCFSRAGVARPAFPRLGRSALWGMLPGKKVVLSQLKRLRGRQISAALDTRGFNMKEMHLDPVLPHPDEPPSLIIVVDAEGEFDWSKPFNRSLPSVGAMASQEQAQSVFDCFGLRPIYLVDYAVASQPEGYEPLRRILDRHGCVIGAHLHPWINPPFEEALNDYNTYGGNLSPALEAAKLRTLIGAIETNFGVRPLFFKAGRYGIGQYTLATLARLGFNIDFSIFPMGDFQRNGGASFRLAKPLPYHVGFSEDYSYPPDPGGSYSYRPEQNSILSMPMTRAQIGMLAPLSPRLYSMLRSPLGKRLWLPNLFSRLRLTNTVTLTPEGANTHEQSAMLRTLVAKGYRKFVLHYHSPSLVPGHTPYVQTSEDLKVFLQNLRQTCEFFFEQIGGLPGHPADLLPNDCRDRIWPADAKAI